MLYVPREIKVRKETQGYDHTVCNLTLRNPVARRVSPCKSSAISTVLSRGAAREKIMVARASSMEFRLAAARCCKLHARIQDDAAAASSSPSPMVVARAFSTAFDAAAVSR